MTLLELMMVVSIIGILLAVAIPTFTQARAKAQDRTAQLSVRTGYITNKFHYLEARAYTETAGTLSALEPSITFVAGSTPAVVGSVYVSVVANTPAQPPNPVFVSAKSSSGKCWYIRQNPTLGTVDYASSATCATATGLTYAARW